MCACVCDRERGWGKGEEREGERVKREERIRAQSSGSAGKRHLAVVLHTFLCRSVLGFQGHELSFLPNSPVVPLQGRTKD